MPPSLLFSLVEASNLEILLVEDELDVGLRVRQALLLQGLPQLRGAAEKDPHFRPVGNKHISLDKH